MFRIFLDKNNLSTRIEDIHSAKMVFTKLLIILLVSNISATKTSPCRFAGNVVIILYPFF